MSERPASQPAQVFLFSGHMVDAPDRKTARFPPDKVPIAGRAIAAQLDALQAAAGDLAICGGACGGDLLFAEAALARGAVLELYLPFEEPEFLTQSVDFAGPEWRTRYEAAKARATLHLLPRERPAKSGESPYELNNLWMLQAASHHGAQRLHFICLWNGQGGDGPGGTQHLVQQVRRLGGSVHVLDTTRLWS